MIKFWVCLVEAFWVRYNLAEPYGRFLAWLIDIRGSVLYQVEVWQTRFRRFRIGRQKKSHIFTWWTYWVALRRSLRVARICKRKWARSELDVHTCLASYERYTGVQKRAFDKGYVKLASENIHDRTVL